MYMNIQPQSILILGAAAEMYTFDYHCFLGNIMHAYHASCGKVTSSNVPKRAAEI